MSKGLHILFMWSVDRVLRKTRPNPAQYLWRRLDAQGAMCSIWFMDMSSWRLRLGLPKATFYLLALCIVVYLLQVVSANMLHLRLEGVFGLSVAGAMQGKLWQFSTYQLLHGSTFHLFVNMLMFYFLGSEVERAIGIRHFLTLYFLSGILGGLGWLLLTYPYEGVCVGASAAIFGLLSAFAVLFPQRRVTLLLFFIIPITLKAWVLAVGLGVIQLLFTISPGVGGIAYSAHLAGALAGLIYTLAIFRPGLIADAVSKTKASNVRKRNERTARRNTAKRAEVDRLLEKITREGIHSLTPAERSFLEEASRRK